MIDRDFLKELSEAPSVGTACGPVLSVLSRRFGLGFATTLMPDGFCLFQPSGGRPESIRVVLVSHVDEVGGCVYGERSPEDGGGFAARWWGNAPGAFAGARLQGFDYLADEAEEAYPVTAEIVTVNDEDALVLRGEQVRPYRTGWTFDEVTTFSNDVVEGKALDPRVTAYCVAEAVQSMGKPSVAALFVMAEECAMDVARKAVTYLQRNAPNLLLVVNADVPGLANLADSRLDLPAIRIYEGRNFIDPSFGIRMADRLSRQGVEFHLTAARSGSQTILFTPLAPTISVALPTDAVHMPRSRMSLNGIERCVKLLTALASTAT